MTPPRILAALVVVVALFIAVGFLGSFLYADKVARDSAAEAARIAALEAADVVERRQRSLDVKQAKDSRRGCKRNRKAHKANAESWEKAAQTRFKTARNPQTPLAERKAAADAGAFYMQRAGTLRSLIVDCDEAFPLPR